MSRVIRRPRRLQTQRRRANFREQRRPGRKKGRRDRRGRAREGRLREGHVLGQSTSFMTGALENPITFDTGKVPWRGEGASRHSRVALLKSAHLKPAPLVPTSLASESFVRGREFGLPSSPCWGRREKVRFGKERLRSCKSRVGETPLFFSPFPSAGK